MQSVAANEDFCSDECAEAHGVATHEQLLPGYDHPFRTGWKLWARSLGMLIRYTAPQRDSRFEFGLAVRF